MRFCSVRCRVANHRAKAMRGHEAMTKPKFKPRGMVRPDTVFHLCSRVDGEWYATITARSDLKAGDPIVAIAGPFADLEQAKAHNGQCMELSRRNRQFYLVDMPSVPADGSLADVCRDLTKG